MLPTPAPIPLVRSARRAAVAALALVITASVGACGSSERPDYNHVDYPTTPTTHATVTGNRTTQTGPTHQPVRTAAPATRARTTTIIRGSVPAILVGTWSGGSEGETAGTTYTFAPDGRFQIRRYGQSLTGVAVARGSNLTFYFSGKSVTSSWDVTALPEVYGYRSYNLELGGYSYVRDA